MEDWVALAEERLRGTGVRCFAAPGNDDFLSIDAAMQSSDVVEFAENRLIRLDETHEMITTGYSNPTPWDTERELPEDELRARIDAMAASVTRPGEPDRGAARAAVSLGAGRRAGAEATTSR